ncbi:hypothetical protein N7456_012468 [Penicillium angulare]|uniref:Uncharacterized protein n=1 Tax=Penicillium angulare TaxID=116970 RepID=A0A9W9EVQ3_9EURO|nr:hypothetical protein N7456_012468 [Penicillium angulare]
MAHQAHNIPWACLTSNLRWSAGSRPDGRTSDFHPRFKPNQRNDFTHFAKMFAKNIEEHSNCERKKYPATYEPPDSNEDIIGDRIAAKIFPTVRKWREECPGNFDCSKSFCEASERDGPCCPILPLHERKMSAFCRRYGYGPCYGFYRSQASGYFNMELVKTLVLYGEMEPLLRACAHPDVAIKGWYNIDECGCNVSDETFITLFLFPVDPATDHDT